jgi:hypothetical protein
VLSKPALALAVLVTVVLLLLAFPGQLAADSGAFLTLILFGCLRLVADLTPIHGRRYRLTEGTVAADFALLLLVGLGGATFVAGLTAAIRTIMEPARGRAVHPLLTIARAVVVVGLAGLAYDVVANHRLLPLNQDALPAILAAAATYVGCDLILAAANLIPSKRATGESIWPFPARWIAIQYVGLLMLGALTAVIFSVSPVGCLILVLPIGVAQYTLRSAMNARRSIRAAIEALAAEIDQREAYTAEHSDRCALYARKICHGLRLGAQDTELIVGVARIHDLGKMNIWPEMLNKPGPLDDAERLEMNRHPAYGAEILAGFVDYRHARDIIMHHHERYDGRGYPAGLSGEQIPLGSRIVAVVDAFDAMTSNRPYRGALSFERAVAELETNAGVQFDSAVVAAFVAAVRPEDVPQLASIRSLAHTTEALSG